MVSFNNTGITLISLLFILALGCSRSNVVDRDGRIIHRESAPQPDVSENAAQSSVQSETSSATPAENGLIGTVEFGKSAYYSDSFQGKKTVSGEIYDRNKLTAAHPSLPMGTRGRVTNLRNGKTVEVHINDRCSTKTGRILDLSYEAASRLDGISEGIMEVKLEIIE
jgi:rare lipoprotein A